MKIGKIERKAYSSAVHIFDEDLENEFIVAAQQLGVDAFLLAILTASVGGCLRQVHKPVDILTERDLMARIEYRLREWLAVPQESHNGGVVKAMKIVRKHYFLDPVK